MIKKNSTTKPNGNVFKTIVRSVVREELDFAKKELRVDINDRLTKVENNLTSTIEDKIEAPFLKYRNEIMTKLDGIAGSLKALHEENIIHQGKHDEIEEQLNKLERLHPRGQHSTN